MYDPTTADSTASVRHRSRAVPAAVTAPASSVQFSVNPFATFTTQTTGAGGANGELLQGGAELNCDSFMIGGATYWLTSGSDFVTGIGVPAASPTTFFRVVGGNDDTAFAVVNATANILIVAVEAFDDTGDNEYGPVNLEIAANGHYAFNANVVLTTLPTDFSGSFELNGGGQQFRRDRPRRPGHQFEQGRVRAIQPADIQRPPRGCQPS